MPAIPAPLMTRHFVRPVDVLQPIERAYKGLNILVLRAGAQDLFGKESEYSRELAAGRRVALAIILFFRRDGCEQTRSACKG